MNPLAQRSIEADLDRLERQRDAYALALASSHDDRTRTRHARTLARLDEEIAALLGALEAIVYAPSASAQSLPVVDGVPVVEHTTELEPAEYEELRPHRPRWTIPIAVVLGVALLGGLFWALWPAPSASPAAAPPAPVIITSPVPPDADGAPAR